MLKVKDLKIGHIIPTVGYEIKPTVVIQLPNDTTSTEDVPASAPVNHLYLRYKWYRVEENGPQYEVGSSRTYTPTAEDTNCTLKLEVAVVSTISGVVLEPVSSISTEHTVFHLRRQNP